MSSKKLLSQTILYGISTILVRLVGWILTPYYTYVISQKELGIVGELFSIVAILNIIYMIGMETSFFRFINQFGKMQMYRVSTNIVLLASLFISSILILFSDFLSSLLKYEDKSIYVILFAGVLFFDNVTNISFAKLRNEGNSLKFVILKMLNVFINLSLNIIFIKYFKGFYGLDNISLIILANLIPSFLLFIFFSKEIFDFNIDTKGVEYKKILKYSSPLIFVGIAGMFNETIDRVMLKYLLPFDLDKNLMMVGIYNANYKLSIIMTLVVQSFKMGAEPFFFKNSNNKDSKLVYSKIMNYFVLFCTLIFVIVSLNIDIIGKLNHKSYAIGLSIVPILLIANMLLGIYYNTSIWYKLTDKNHYGLFISIIGVILTLVLNYLYIPVYGIIASAFVTFICYFIMTILSFYFGNKYYPINYNYKFIFLWIIFSIFYFFISKEYKIVEYQSIIASFVFLGISTIMLLKLKKQN